MAVQQKKPKKYKPKKIARQVKRAQKKWSKSCK